MRREDLCGFQHASAAVGTGATRWRRASSPPAAGTAGGGDGIDAAVVLGGETIDIVVFPGGRHLNCVPIRDVPCLLPRRRRRRRGLTFQAAHVFLLAPYELGPPLRRRCARICVIAAGPPRSLYATTRQSRRLSRPRHRRFGFSWAVPVGGRGHS